MLLGIDQGTTGTRACLVEPATGRIVRQAYAAHAQIQPRPGWIEHDANEIWACTASVIEQVLRGAAKPAGVAIANQGETIMIWDARTRAPLYHSLVWQDTRTAPRVEMLARDRGIDERVRALTGLRLDPYFSAPKLEWLLDEVPGARTNPNLRAGTLDTWLIDRLTDGDVFATDASTAARTLLCDIDRASWSTELCELFRVPMSVLPEIRDTDAGFGACKGHGLDGVPILASIVDQPGALVGQGCIDRGDAKATFGTGCFVYVNTGPTRPPAGETLATIAWRRSGKTTYALDGGVLAVGTAIAWTRELGLLDGELDDLPARIDHGVVCVPALVGLGAPHWNRGARAAWLGMSSATSRADLVHALVDGIACRVAEVVDAMHVPIGELRADGGLTRSAALMQRQADILGRSIAIAEEDEATVVGACALAALRAGLLDEATLRARKTTTRARYEPRISADERGAIRARFARALAASVDFR